MIDCKHYNNGYCEIEQAHIPPSWCKERCKLKFPSLANQAVSFTKAVVNHIKEGRPARTIEQQERIKAICRECEFYREKNGSPRCSKCGCFLNIKARWATANCPEGKWEVKNTGLFLKSNGENAGIVDLFKGQSIFLIGNGKSFADVDKSLFAKRGIMTACMNNGAANFKPNLWIGQDPPAKFVEHIWKDPTIMKFTRLTNASRRYWVDGRYGDFVKTCPNVWYHHLKSEPKPDLWREEDRINWAVPYGEAHRPTVFMAALHILYFLGFKRVYLIGTDFKMDKENPYFFNEKQPQGVVNYNNLLYQAIDDYLKRIKFGDFKITNCTENSGLTAFDYMPLEEAIKKEEVDTSQDTKGMYVDKNTKDKISSSAYNYKKGIVYYTNNVIDGTKLDIENKMTVMDSDLPIVSVSHKPIDLGYNIVVDKPSCGQSLFEQIIIGIENSDFEYIYLCEHDCLYHPSHFEYETNGLAVNVNVWSLTEKGYQNSKKLYPLSCMSGQRDILLAAIKDKYEICKANNGKIRLYEPGRGEGKYGRDYPVDKYESEFATIDVRHKDSFTDRKVVPDWAMKQHLYFWDDYKTLRDRLGV